MWKISNERRLLKYKNNLKSQSRAKGAYLRENTFKRKTLFPRLGFIPYWRRCVGCSYHIAEIFAGLNEPVLVYHSQSSRNNHLGYNQTKAGRQRNCGTVAHVKTWVGRVGCGRASAKVVMESKFSQSLVLEGLRVCSWDRSPLDVSTYLHLWMTWIRSEKQHSHRTCTHNTPQCETLLFLLYPFSTWCVSCAHCKEKFLRGSVYYCIRYCMVNFKKQ